MKAAISLLLPIILCFECLAQNIDSRNTDPSPVGGVNRLALNYFGIEFTKEQRRELKTSELELIFLIESTGKSILEEINGIQDTHIIDSLVNRSNNILFNPKLENGIPKEALYFLKLEFPAYAPVFSTLDHANLYLFHKSEIEDFDFLEISSRRIDLMIGGLLNHFVGNPGSYLATGGGFKVDVSWAGDHHYLFGLSMSIYGNKLKKNYPLHTTRKQFDSPPTMLIGATFGKWISPINGERNFNLQIELNYSIQNLTENQVKNDPDWVQLRGFSPGVVLNYSKQIGRNRTSSFYGGPTLASNNLNFSLGIKPIFFNLSEATGLMIEFGIGYRLTGHLVTDFSYD